MKNGVIDILEMKYPQIDFKEYIYVSRLGLDPSYCNSYEPTPDDVLDVLRKIVVTTDDRIIDIGAGKGYVMHLMSDKPFSRIDGIEMCGPLISIAKNNLKILHPNEAERFHFYEMDAALFTRWQEYNYFYMYNPFKENCFKRVIERIVESITEFPRKVTIIYYNPVFDHIIMCYGLFTRSEALQNCYVYTSIID